MLLTAARCKSRKGAHSVRPGIEHCAMVRSCVPSLQSRITAGWFGLSSPCTVEDVAADAAFSRFQCQRMFRAMTGESIADLARRLHLERAAWRLRHESVGVTEVALDAGYNSAEAFSRAFRRSCGMSPSHYRTTWPPPKFGSPVSTVRYYPGEERVEVDLPSEDRLQSRTPRRPNSCAECPAGSPSCSISA